MSESERLESCIEGLRKDQQNGYHGDCMSAEDREVAVSALEELQVYRGIGTVEECKEARERQIPKKPLNITKISDFYGNCPCCGEDAKRLWAVERFCIYCGQALDWSSP